MSNALLTSSNTNGIDMVEIMETVRTSDKALYRVIQGMSTHKLARDRRITVNGNDIGSEQDLIDNWAAGLDKYGRLTVKQIAWARNVVQYNSVAIRTLVEMKRARKNTQQQQQANNNTNDPHAPPF